jgi:ABC-2 type transport system ATP-binding protein
MISIKNLIIRYPETKAINNLSLELNDGNIYGLVGPNGAGKSTLIKALVGIISQYSGEICYDQLILKKNRHRIKGKVGYAPEDTELIPYLTGNEYLQMLADIRGTTKTQEKINTLIDNLQLANIRGDLIESYSHGMKQKLAVASALLDSPKTIILDEALNGLDPIAMFNLKRLIQNLAEDGHLILISSHVLELVESWCDYIMVLNQGKLIAKYSKDQIKQIKKKEGKEFSAYFVDLVK